MAAPASESPYDRSYTPYRLYLIHALQHKPENSLKKIWSIRVLCFSLCRVACVQRIAKSDPIEPIIMSTKDTIRIVLNGGADEHTVDLGGEQCVSVYVVDGKLKCQVQGVGDGQVIKKPAAPGIRPGCQMRGFGGAGQLTSFYLKLEESRKKIEQL